MSFFIEKEFVLCSCLVFIYVEGFMSYYVIYKRILVNLKVGRISRLIIVIECLNWYIL